MQYIRWHKIARNAGHLHPCTSPGHQDAADWSLGHALSESRQLLVAEDALMHAKQGSDGLSDQAEESRACLCAQKARATLLRCHGCFSIIPGALIYMYSMLYTPRRFAGVRFGFENERRARRRIRQARQGHQSRFALSPCSPIR